MSAGAASLALQRALHAALTGDAGVMALLTGIFDAVPPGTRLPYAVIGADVVTDWSHKSGTGHEHRFQVALWDEAAGSARLKQAMAAVEAAVVGLEGAGIESGLRLTGLRFLRAQVAREASGPARGLVEFRVRSVGA